MAAKNNGERKMKFGVLGCGRISEKHLAALTAETMPTELVAVADLIEEKAREKGEKYGAPYYTDGHAMMEAHPEIEVLDILTPTGYHAEHVVEYAPHARHIVVEKPMALRVADCDAMVAACEEAGVRLFVVKQNRFNRAVQAARRVFEEGRLGRMVMGTIRVRWRRDQYYYDQADWRGTWALDGGVMSQQASHHLDLLQWFMGPVESVQCQITARLLDIEAEDTAVAIFKFKDGALGAFEATTATRPEQLEGSLSLLGENGTIIITGVAVNMIDYWKFEEELPEDERVREEHSQEVPNVYGHGHAPYLAHVVECLLEDKPALVDGAEGKKNIEILQALYESAARNGAPVVPGEPTPNSRLGER